MAMAELSFSHPQLAQNGHHRAPVGEGALEKVGTDEGGEPQPVGIMEMGEGDADHDEKAGDQTQEAIDCHDVNLRACFSGSRP